MWHPDFREAFVRMSKDDANLRHRQAVTVLSNFVQIPDSKRSGGLSGAYLPTPLHLLEQPAYVATPQFAIAANETDARWHATELQGARQQAHMVCLRPPASSENAVATMLGFDLHRMLKETNQYNPAKGLSNYERLIGYKQPDGTILFSRDQP